MENVEQEIIDNSSYTHFVRIKFLSSVRTYYFGVKDLKLNVGDKVVIENVRGLVIGEVSSLPIPMSEFKDELSLKPIIRIATEEDLKNDEINEKDAASAKQICQEEINRLGLNMNLISCEYTLDRTKVLFTYLADERVDFRELLKALASKLHTRIELRQIGTRDKSKMIGGLGICGLPLCCSTFLNEFDGISIARAKNQMLAINIPKLSGHCGKLMCCLKYEDDTYTDLKKKFPEIGYKVFIEKKQYTVSNINVISNVIKVENEDDIKVLSYEDFVKLTGFKVKKKDNEEK